MTSKAEKKRIKKAASHIRAMRGSQNAGRPRQEGERYPSGKLKPRKNERVIEAKRALVGPGMDIALAEDPLDFIHAKGWLSTARYRTALSYRDTRRRANVGAPRLDGGGIQETSTTTGVIGRSFHDMSDSEITEVFDHVFRDAPSTSAEEREALAMQRWKKLEAAMTPDQRREVGLVVIQGSWTFWITALNLGKQPVGRSLKAMEDFHAGLAAMARSLKPTVVSSDSQGDTRYQPAPDQKPLKVEEQLRFVDEDGQPFELTSEKGRPFQVARKVRA
jgi:hypothetical protein